MNDNRKTILCLLAASLVTVWRRDAGAATWSSDEAGVSSAGGPPATADTASSSGTRAKRPDPLRIGVLGGVGFPRPLALEALIVLGERLALGAEYSLLPKLTLGPVETRFWAVAADARVFPFGGAFFLGARAGRQHLAADGSVTVPGYGAVAHSITVDTTFVNPRAGFLWTFDGGLTLGIDAGVQLPLASREASTLPGGVPVATDVSNVADRLGQKAIPTVDLLRLGFLL